MVTPAEVRILFSHDICCAVGNGECFVVFFFFFFFFFLKVIHTLQFRPIMVRPQQHENIFMKCIPPPTPILYCETEVYRGTPFLLMFALKH